MPSQIKQDAIDMILATVRDNPSIISAEVIKLVPIASSTVKLCITRMIKEKIIVMVKSSTDRLLYTPEYVAANDIKGTPFRQTSKNKLEEKPIESILASQLKFNELFQVAQ